jgi:D-arabinose 1-dehydrogenase-like Zn-dependent alcohol dehydrogenase
MCLFYEQFIFNMTTANISEMQNPSWFLYGPGSAKIQDAPVPTIQNGHEVVVRIKFIGVCGSDVSTKFVTFLP